MTSAQAQHGTPRSNKGSSATRYPTSLSDRPIKLIVAGSRGWCCSYHPRNDHATCVECRSFVRSLGTLIGYAVGSDLSQVHLIHGDCKSSPDVVAEVWAKANNVPFTAMPAEWDHYGKSAGARRNTKMAERATHLVAVWDGSSNGTRNMIEQAKKLGLRVQKFAANRGFDRAPAPATQNEPPRHTQGPLGEHRARSIESGARWGGAHAPVEKSAAVRSVYSRVPETAQSMSPMGKSGDFWR